MVPQREYRHDLRDYQKVSYWLYIKEPTSVLIEAAGRSVSDVQLWLNGQWLVKSKRSGFSEAYEPERPLKGIRVSERLKEGYYRVTVYGGRPEEWSKESEEYPCYISFGFENLPSSGYGRYEISEKGYNRYFTESLTEAVLLSLPEKKPAELRVAGYKKDSPSFSSGASDSINSRSKSPRCIVRPNRSSKERYVITVSGKPGQVFTLKTMGSVDSRFQVSDTGDYWISSIHSGFPGDQIGVTGGIASRSDGEILKSEFDTVSYSRSVFRRFNLLDDITLYVWFEKSGKYSFTPGETEMDISVRRVLNSKGSFRSRKFDTAKTLDLNQGLYRIRLSPEKKGIGTLVIKNAGILKTITDFISMGATKPRVDTGNPCIQFPKVHLNKGERYLLLLNKLSPEVSATVIREYPIDIRDALPVYLEPDQPVSFDVEIESESKLEVTDPEGRDYKAYIDGKEVSTPYTLSAGEYRLRLTSTEKRYLFVSAKELYKLPDADPDPFPTGDESPLPIFPELVKGEQRFFNIGRRESKILEFDVPKAGLYRLETEGRLHTGLTLRNRFEPNTERRKGNGIGRNSRILRYLLPGRYQVRLETHGKSAGRCGLVFDLNPVIDGDILEQGREKRYQLKAGTGIKHSILIENQGEYSLSSKGLYGYYNCRLEDEERWPVVNPGRRADIKREFEPGRYRFLTLPGKVDRLCISSLRREEETVHYKGKGPHNLKLNTQVSSIWHNPDDTENLDYASYNFDIPAPIKISYSITQGFTAELYNRETGDSIGVFSGSDNYSIESGCYELRVYPEEECNLKQYRVSIDTDVLVSGLSYNLRSGNKTFEVSVGTHSITELFSQGMNDVEGFLYDSENRLIAHNDDDTRNWNFKISSFLDSGKYKLKVKTITRGKGNTVVSMNTLNDTAYKAWALNEWVSMNLKGKLHHIPVTINDTDQILYLSSKTQSSLSFAIDKKTSQAGFKRIAGDKGMNVSGAVPVSDTGDYRVSIWSTDHLNENIEAVIGTEEWYSADIEDLREGERFFVKRDLPVNRIWLRVDMQEDSLGYYRVLSDRYIESVKYTRAPDQGFVSNSTNLVSSLKRGIWVECSYSEKRIHKINMHKMELEEKKYIESNEDMKAFILPGKLRSVDVTEFTMEKGRPQCGVLTSNNSAKFKPYGFNVYSGVNTNESECLSVRLPNDESVSLLWDSDLEANPLKSVFSIENTTVPIEEEYDLGLGFKDISIPCTTAYLLNLSEKKKLGLKITLPEGIVAVYDNPGVEPMRKLFCVAPGKKVENFEFKADQGRLFFVNTGNKNTVSIQASALKGRDVYPKNTISVGSGIERRMYSEGSAVFSIDETMSSLSDNKLFYNGSVKRVDWWSGNGFFKKGIVSGDKMRLPTEFRDSQDVAGGYLVVNYEPGWIKADICQGDENECVWGSEYERGKPIEVKDNSLHTLQQGVNRFGFILHDTMHIRMRSDVNLVCGLSRNGSIIDTRFSLDGFDINYPLPPGEYGLRVRAPGDRYMKGTSLSFSFIPIVEVSEDDHESINLSKGTSRIVSFHINERKKIGIGLDTENETVRAVLLNTSLDSIAGGQQMFLPLEKGRYYLHLSVPSLSKPTSCIVRIFGQNVPENRPPESIISRLKQLSE